VGRKCLIGKIFAERRWFRNDEGPLIPNALSRTQKQEGRVAPPSRDGSALKRGLHHFLPATISNQTHQNPLPRSIIAPGSGSWVVPLRTAHSSKPSLSVFRGTNSHERIDNAASGRLRVDLLEEGGTEHPGAVRFRGADGTECERGANGGGRRETSWEGQSCNCLMFK